MSTSHHVASHKEVTTSLPTSAVRILAALTLLVVGTFIGIVISHRVISAQVAHYGNTQMAGGSVLINVLDDIAPYLAYTMVGGVVLLPLTLTAWIWSRPMSRGLRNAAVVLLTGMIILSITLLVACKTEGPPASQAPTIPRTPVTRVTLTAAPPATEHHLTVTPPALVEASPSPEPTVYRNPAYHFEVAYPWDFIIDGACPTEGIIDSPVVSFRLREASYYQGTNLLDACVVIDVDRREDARSTCTGTRGPNEDHLGQETINGALFSIISRGGVAAGHIYDVTSYRTVHAGGCYEISLLVHASNPGVYEPGTVSEFDKDAVMARLKALRDRFAFTDM